MFFFFRIIFLILFGISVMTCEKIYIPISQRNVPALRYAYTALEPFIDNATMVFHHSKHFQGYLDNYQKVNSNEIATFPMNYILARLQFYPESIRNTLEIMVEDM